MSIKLTPLEDKIIVKQAEAQTQTASGLYIPAVSYTHLTLPTT